MSADQIISSRDGTSEQPQRPTIVFYRHDGLLVTSRFVAIDGYRYAISHLNDLTPAKGSIHPGVVAGIVTAAVEAAILTPLASALHRPLAWFLAVTALLVPCLVAVVCAVRWPPRWDLYIRYRGRMVTVYSTRDHLEFGKVHRAVIRALEAHRSG